MKIFLMETDLFRKPSLNLIIDLTELVLIKINDCLEFQVD